MQSAIAHLINAYAAAVPNQIADADQSARYLAGIRGYLAPQLRTLRRGNDATTAANTPLRLVSGAGTGQVLGHPLEYDLHANGPTGAIGFFGGASTVTAVTVPAANAGQVNAALGANDEITITPAPGFTGLTYVDYSVRHPSGETRNGRIYLRVR